MSDDLRVHPPTDDLPQSPTGRVPQWVIDDHVAVGQDLPVYAPVRRRRRRPGLAVVAAVAVLGAGAWWWTSGAPALPDEVASSLTGLVRPAPEPPSAEVVALADAAHLSAEGRELLYGTRTEILGIDEFAGRCRDVGVSPVVRTDGAVGCFNSQNDSIVVYAPADPRLRGFVVETVAHETLHAAWDVLDTAEQARLTTLLESVVASVPADDDLHEQLAGSVGGHGENRPTELFAYVGTQVWRDGGLDPELEAVYARFVADRAALVAVHTGWVAVLDESSAAIQVASDALVAQEYANASERAHVDGDAASIDFYRESYDAKVAEVAAMPASERRRLLLSWGWWDGTALPMAPADETLAAAAALLARDEAALPGRYAAVETAEALAATERARVEAMVADLDGLQRALDPVSAAQPG
ncbi:hypothetical protein [Cellulomonas sp. P5_C5]